MKNIKAFEDFGSSNLTEGENHHENYMFFQHLMTIKDAIEDLLSMDRRRLMPFLTADTIGLMTILQHLLTTSKRFTTF